MKLIKFLVSSLTFFYAASLKRIGSLVFKINSADGPFPSEPANLLVVKRDEIGDLVMLTPFLRELRKNFPGAQIELLTHSLGVELFRDCPYLNSLLDAGPRRRQPTYLPSLDPFFLREKIFKKKSYDAVFVPRWDLDAHQSTAAAYLSGAHFRAGYSEKCTPEKSWANRGLDMLLTRAMEDKTVRHEVEQNLGLLTALGLKVTDDSLEMWSGKDDDKTVSSLLVKGHLNADSVLIAFCPGAAEAKRMWPIERYIELGKRLCEAYPNLRILILGSAEEKFLAAALKEALKDRVVDATGKTNLRESFRLLQRCAAYCGSDTGAGHLAAAAGIPVVIISCHPRSGSSSSVNAPQRIRPWTRDFEFLQPDKPRSSRCHAECVSLEAHCISQITVEEAARSLQPWVVKRISK